MTDLTALPLDLLVPLLDSAAATLQELPVADVPVAARPLLGFDRRGLTRGPARLQLRRALQDEAQFREQAFAAFCDRPEVRALLDEWSASEALVLATHAVELGELALLASALIAAAPEGVDFGLGVVVAIDAAQRRTGDEQTQTGAMADRVDDLEEGLRRLEVARAELTRERDALADQLRAERRERRERERDDRFAADAAVAARRVVELEAEVARAVAHQERAEAARERAVARGERSQVERARADERRERAEAERADAVARAEALATELDALRRAAPEGSELGESRESRDSAAQTSRPPARGTAPGPIRRRARPTLPGGLFADSPPGVDAMLRSGPVLLVVDGYNVSKAAGPSASLALERESLVRALHSLHLTSGADVLVVFDGDGTPAFSKTNRPAGVRVVFSSPGVEADSVVVESVAATPLHTPVVVASSDRWVREHSETFGAVVVSAATLVTLLRRAPGRAGA
ncbi:MAG: hypothetical protein QOH10_1080 [Actinomycetota bacterium]|nr:hypothetical protein [Actinomycetota bacterium]